MTSLFRYINLIFFIFFHSFLVAQCPESIQLVGQDKLKLTFNPSPSSIPESITYLGTIYPLTQSGGSGNFTTDRNTFEGPELPMQLTINYSGPDYTCEYDTNGDLLFSVLPVELSDFRGRLKGEDIILNWTTTKEENNLGFEIEQSFDGVNFSKIGMIPGHDYSARPIDYNFTDHDLRIRSFGNTVYYRLVQIDFDGQKTYTDVIAIDLNLDFEQFEITKITGWNSSERIILVHFYNPYQVRKINFLISDVNGHIIEKRSVYPELGLNTFEVDLSDEKQTFYFLYMDNGKEIITGRVAMIWDY